MAYRIGSLHPNYRMLGTTMIINIARMVGIVIALIASVVAACAALIPPSRQLLIVGWSGYGLAITKCHCVMLLPPVGPDLFVYETGIFYGTQSENSDKWSISIGSSSHSECVKELPLWLWLTIGAASFAISVPWKWIQRPNDRICKSCGYSRQGLQTTVCPECGGASGPDQACQPRAP